MLSAPFATRGHRTGIESLPVESQFITSIGDVCVPAVVSFATMKYENGIEPVPPLGNAPTIPPLPAISKFAAPVDVPAIIPEIPSPGNGDFAGDCGFNAALLSE
jgi:hypothetical protein